MIRSAIVSLALLATIIRPAAALTFDFTTISGDTLSAAEATAFGTAANAWSSVLTDPITVNVTIGFRALGSNILGETASQFQAYTGAAVGAALAADATSVDDRGAVATYARSTQAYIALTSSQARALHLRGFAGYDGTIEFSTGFSFSDKRDAQGHIAPGTYDLVGIAEHEIGHLLGFDSSIDGETQFYIGSQPTAVQTLLDQFRFAVPLGQVARYAVPSYFSLDSGLTPLANFSTGLHDQASHWLQGTGGVMDPEAAPGATQNIAPIDIRALDAIGYDVAVAEPTSLILLATAVAALVWTRRRSPVSSL